MEFKRYLIPILLIMATLPTESKFVWQNLTAPFFGVAVLDKDHYYICGGDGKMIYTEDGGGHYQNLETGTYLSYNDIKLFGNSFLAVAADTGTVLISKDKGKSWLVKPVDKSQTFNKINIVDENTIVVSSVEGKIFKSTDSGENWIKIFEKTGSTIVTIKFLSSGTGYALVNNADSSGYLAKTTDGGVKWNNVLQTNIKSWFRVMDFLNEQKGFVEAWILDKNDKYYYRTRIYKTFDGCKAWDTLFFEKDKGQKSSAKYIDDSTIVLFDISTCLKSTDSGDSWTSDSVNGKEVFTQYKGYENWLYHDNMDSDGKGFVVTVGGIYNEYVTKSFNNFASYKVEKFCALTSFSLNTVADPLDIVNISKDRYIFTTDYGRVMESVDGGNSWNWFYPTNEEYKDSLTPVWQFVQSSYPIIYYDKKFQKGFIISNKGVLDTRFALYSDSGFKKLTKINNVGVLSNDNFCKISDSSFIATIQEGGSIYFQKTKDFGANWKRKKINTNKDEGCSGIFYSQGITYLLFSYSYRVEDSITGHSESRIIYKLWKSADEGETFDTIFTDETTLPNQYRGLYFTDKDNGMMLGIDSIIKRTSDGGKTWIDQALLNNENIQIIEFFNDTIVVAVGYCEPLFYSTDKGYTWQTEALPFKEFTLHTNNYPMRVKKLDDGYIYVLHDTKIIRGKWVEPGETKAVDDKTEEDESNPWFYIATKPNPASNMMWVKVWGMFSVNGKQLTVKIYNINGVEIKDVSKAANDGNNGYTSEFNVFLNDLPKGVYIIKLSCGSYFKTHKFIRD